MLRSLFEALEGSALSVALRASEWVYPLVNTLHILGIALLLGPILILDVRVLLALRVPAPPYGALPVATMAAVLLPAARIGFALAVASGLLLFTARPLDYAFHRLFQLKLACIGLALVNIVALHRSGALADAVGSDRRSQRVRVACGVSLVCWTGALGLGRWVGYR